MARGLSCHSPHPHIPEIPSAYLPFLTGFPDDLIPVWLYDLRLGPVMSGQPLLHSWKCYSSAQQISSPRPTWLRAPSLLLHPGRSPHPQLGQVGGG